MTVLKAFFWNREQARLRTGFRIILQLTLFYVIMKSLKLLIGVPGEITISTSLWIILALAAIRLLRVLISVWLAGRFLDRRPFAEFGFHFKKDWWIDLSFGLVSGVILIGSVFVIELAAGWITISDTFQTVNPGQFFIMPYFIFLMFFLCVGFSEELFYRGYHLTNLAEGLNFKFFGPKAAIIFALIFSSLLFGIFHLGSPNASVVSTLNIVLWGILFGGAYVLTGSLAIPIGIHISWNLFQGNVFGFPVSGVTFPADTVTFISIDQAGPELWTGGAFGPEAGLLGFFAIILGILLIVGWIRWRKGSVKLYVQLAQPPLRVSKSESS